MDLKLNIWIRYLLPLFIALYLGFVMFLMGQFKEPPEFRWYGLFWFVLTVYLMWEAGWYISQKLENQLPWRTGTFKRLMVQLITMTFVGILIYLTTYVLLNLYENEVLHSNNPLSIFHLLVACAMAFIHVQIINAVQIGYLLLTNWQEVQIESEQIQKIKAIEQIENIRLQMDGQVVLEKLAELEGVMAQSPGVVADHLQKVTDAYHANMGHFAGQLEEVQEVLQISPFRHGQEENRIGPRQVFRKRFLVRSGPKMSVVTVDEIAGFYKDELVLLLTVKGKKYVVDYSLEELASMLPPADFFRINRQCIVHIAAIQEVRAEGSQLSVTMTVDFPKSLLASQRNSSAFKKWLNEDF
ncbi:MAG: LytTR family DNA-binding domain-containing protein [Bacteroidota bacterium]